MLPKKIFLLDMVAAADITQRRKCKCYEERNRGKIRNEIENRFVHDQDESTIFIKIRLLVECFDRGLVVSRTYGRNYVQKKLTDAMKNIL